jgi:hypothetical protein
VGKHDVAHVMGGKTKLLYLSKRCVFLIKLNTIKMNENGLSRE